MENKNTLICTKDTIANLKNASLRKSLNAMLTASKSSRSALWKYAKAVSDIITGETFLDDFETQTEFAKFVDLSKSTITNYVKAVEFVQRKGIIDYFKDSLQDLSVGKAYILSTLDVDTLDDFLDFAKTENLDIINISDRALKYIIKELYVKSEHAADTESADTESADAEFADTESADAEFADTESADADAEPAEMTSPKITATLDESGKNIAITILGKSFERSFMIALNEDIIDVINHDFGE